ncbi:MAG: M48 family metalloprotease [Candidatus Rokubacteria bacterium]|nr:M48 family metalloprotease [Candidatus Rokubacteria bacterium]
MKRGLLAIAIGLASGLLGVGCQAGLDVGSVMTGVMTYAPAVKGAFTDMDEPQEIELGRAVTAGIGARYRVLRDRELTRYVALVGSAVAAHSERPDLRYYFAVLDAPEVNAFAAPGGFVFVTRGALGLMRDEATLAGVLGHEVGHIALRHGVNRRTRPWQGSSRRTRPPRTGSRSRSVSSGIAPGGDGTRSASPGLLRPAEPVPFGAGGLINPPFRVS